MEEEEGGGGEVLGGAGQWGFSHKRGVGEEEGRGSVAASLTSGTANLYGPPAVDGRRVEAWVEGRGDDSVAVGEHTAAGLDWERKEKERKKDLSHQHRHPSVYRRRSSSVQGRRAPSLEVKAGIRFTPGSSHTDEKSSSLMPALRL